MNRSKERYIPTIPSGYTINKQTKDFNTTSKVSNWDNGAYLDTMIENIFHSTKKLIATNEEKNVEKLRSDGVNSTLYFKIKCVPVHIGEMIVKPTQMWCYIRGRYRNR